MSKPWTTLKLLLALSASVAVFAQTPVLDPSDPDYAPCRGSSAAGGPCSTGPGGGLNSGPGGGLSIGPGGGLSIGPGGGLSIGPGGGMSIGPHGGLSIGPNGGLSIGPGGGLSIGPRTPDGYNGPWGPCITGVLGKKWMAENCPGV
jgi:hypothetical protein